MDCVGGNNFFEFLFGGEVHAALGDPLGSEAAGGADVGDAGVELVDEGLEGLPARLRGVQRRNEEAAAPEVVGLEEVEGLEDVMALRAGVELGPPPAANLAEDVDVEGAWDGVVCGQGRRWEIQGKEKNRKDVEIEGKGH